jgi:hypothetical protein
MTLFVNRLIPDSSTTLKQALRLAKLYSFYDFLNKPKPKSQDLQIGMPGMEASSPDSHLIRVSTNAIRINLPVFAHFPQNPGTEGKIKYPEQPFRSQMTCPPN